MPTIKEGEIIQVQKVAPLRCNGKTPRAPKPSKTLFFVLYFYKASFQMNGKKASKFLTSLIDTEGKSHKPIKENRKSYRNKKQIE